MTTLKIFSLEQQLFIQIVVTSGHITTYGLLYLKTGQMSEANRFERNEGLPLLLRLCE